MRARFNPHDGQLYVSGLRGWQTSATHDGGFFRVRYTSGKVRMPQALHVAQNGLRLTFTTELDAAAATDPNNYDVQQWNILYSSNYGSPEFSLKNPGKEGHDPVAVKSIT